MAAVAKSTGINGGKFQDKDKPMEVRLSNITAAKGNNKKKKKNVKISRFFNLILIIFFFFCK